MHLIGENGSNKAEVNWLGNCSAQKACFYRNQWEIICRDIWKTMKRKLLPVSVEKLKNIHQMNWGLISSFKEEKTKIQIRVAKVTFLH